MCGIAGLFDPDDRSEMPRDLLARMSACLAHRGPDGSGIHIEPGVGLAHRRLAIIDLLTGDQPLYNEDGSVVVVFNGEIYNFQELAAELARAGHVFRTRSDTEVIVHAWEHWGESCVQRFRGMFAFALWDRSRSTLFLARDRLGVKPLYYAQLPGGLWIFASELKALLAHPALPRRIEPQAVEDYFAYGYVPEPRTIFSGVYKLDAGCTLSIRRGAAAPRQARYWDVPFAPAAQVRQRDAEAELMERLRESVRLRMIADVPVGAFLSGGVDSSAVVAMMSGLASGDVVTCSIAFGDAAFDESRHAQTVAQLYATRHHVGQVDPYDCSLVDRLASLYDEPYADSSAMPTYRLCELARRFVKVALSGDGGDESFGGYQRYRWHVNEERIRARLPLALRRPVFGVLGQLYPHARWAPGVLRAKATLEALARGSAEAYFHTVSVVKDGMRRSLFSARLRRELGGYTAMSVIARHSANAPSRDPLSLIQYLDLKTYLVGDINTKVDRASMAHGLEVREPLMDHTLVEWLSTLPPGLKLRDGEGKVLLKQALRPHLPRDILYRRKMGFAVPLGSWMRGPLSAATREAVLGPMLADTGWFDRTGLQRLVDEHQSGICDHSTPLWSLTMFDAFLRNALGAGTEQPAIARG